MIPRYALAIAVRREARFEERGVPTVDLWAAGRSMIFRRLTGIVDSGASKTILGLGSHALLGFEPNSGKEESITTAGGGEMRYELHRVQFRLPRARKPPVTFCLEVGLNEIGDNLFGADLLQYFTLVVAPDRVVFMADAERG